MSRIKTVFWDIGGVLLTNGWDRYERAIVLKDYGVDHAEFEKRHAAVFEAWETGSTSAEEYLAETLFYEERNFTAEHFFGAMKAQSQELPNGAFGILRRMAASQQVQLAVLNNEPRELNDHRFREFGLRPLFSCFLSSCYLGLRKPDLRIYQRALGIVQRELGETIFIDDRPENIAAANAVGIHGIQYLDPAQLSRELEGLGIALGV